MLCDTTFGMAQLNLLDLPDEILELIIYHIGCEFGWKSKTLSYRAGIRTVCRKFHDLATPIVFSEFEYDPDSDRDIAFCHERPLLFAQSLTCEPRLALHLRNLSLTRWDGLFVHNDAYHKLFSRTTNSIETLDRYGQLLLSNDSQLTKLNIDYPAGCSFLNLSFPRLREAEVRPIGGVDFLGFFGRKEYPLSGYLNVDFLPYLLQSPELECLGISSAYITKDENIPRIALTPNSSSLEDLWMQVGNFDEAALVYILQAPKALLSFNMHPTTECDVSFKSGSDPANLPRISTIGKALSAQAASLQTLRLSRGNWIWHPNLDTLGSLRSMVELKEIKLDATMLLGWNHCRHHRAVGQPEPLSSFDLAKLLPDNIEHLELALDDHHWYRNRSDYVLFLVWGLQAEQERLWKG